MCRSGRRASADWTREEIAVEAAPIDEDILDCDVTGFSAWPVSSGQREVRVTCQLCVGHRRP